MCQTVLVRPALFVHEFVVANRLRETETAARERFVALWQACADLGMNHPLPALGIPLEIPNSAAIDALGGASFGLIAAREQVTGGAAVYQALLYGAHDTVGFTALLAPNDQSHRWQDLDKLWATTTSTPVADEILGSALVYLALVDTDTDSSQQAAVIADAVGAAIPQSGDGLWTQHWCRIEGRFLVWEAPPRCEGQRRLVVVGPVERERELDAWVWTSGGGVLGPLIRYLLHAAKLRYQLAVYDHDQQRFRVRRREIEDCVDRLLALTQDADAKISITALVRVDAVLGRLQTESEGLITVIARLCQLVRTVEIAAANMATMIPGQYPPGSAFAADHDIASWLQAQIGDDLIYLRATQDRADRVRQLSGATVEERRYLYQHQRALVQTSVIGSLLMALAAIQAFMYKVPLAGPFQAPVIAVLAVLALSLPIALLRWSSSAAPDIQLTAVRLTVVALLGGAVGWLATSVISRQLVGHLATPPWTLLFAIVSAGLFSMGNWWRARSMQRR